MTAPPAGRAVPCAAAVPCNALPCYAMLALCRAGLWSTVRRARRRRQWSARQRRQLHLGCERPPKLALACGVPPRAIVLEDKSRDTYQNAVYSAAMLDKLGVKKILLVTSAFHMRRAEALFNAQGLEVIPAPTDYQRLVGPVTMPGWLPAVSDLWQSTYALHEIVGYQVYRYQGRLQH